MNKWIGITLGGLIGCLLYKSDAADDLLCVDLGGRRIIKNIARKMKSGKYDHKQAPKLWMYWIESGAKLYDKMYSSPGVSSFDKDTKMSVAIQLADEMKAEIEIGNYS